MDEELKKLREAAEGAMDLFERNGNSTIALARLGFVVAACMVDVAVSLRKIVYHFEGEDTHEVMP